MKDQRLEFKDIVKHIDDATDCVLPGGDSGKCALLT